MAVASVFSLVEFLVLRWGSSYVLGALSSALNDSVSKTVNHASIMLVLVQPTSASRVFVFWVLGNPHQARSYRQGPCAVGNTYCTSLRWADSHLLRTGVEFDRPGRHRFREIFFVPPCLASRRQHNVNLDSCAYAM